MVLIQNYTSRPIYIAIANNDGDFFYEPMVYELGPYKEYVYDTSPEYFFALMVNNRSFISHPKSKLKRITIDKTIGIYDDYNIQKFSRPILEAPCLVTSSKIRDYFIDIMQPELKYDFQPICHIHSYSY
jgi:hypothetical protein